MSRYTKRDYRHLARASKCDLCGESFKQGDERQLAAFASHPGFLHVAAHPACVVAEAGRRAERLRELSRNVARGTELIAQHLDQLSRGL